MKRAKMKPITAWANVDGSGAVFDFMTDGHFDIYKTKAAAGAFKTGDERIARVRITEVTK